MSIMLTRKQKIRSRRSSEQPETYAGLRIQVVGGGCSGFSVPHGFRQELQRPKRQLFEFEGLKVFIDKTSLMYMDGAEVDYVEGLHGAGFKFNNPNVDRHLRLRQFV